MKPISRREMEVLYWRAQGLYNSEIADQLHLAESTVKNYAHHATTKLEARTLAGAIWKARRELEEWESQHGTQ
jgi:DNA-binding NarL/FixJ family response regulator